MIAAIHKDSFWAGPADNRYDHFNWRIYYHPGSGHTIFNTSEDDYLHQYPSTWSSTFTASLPTTNNKFLDDESVDYNGGTKYLMKTQEPTYSSNPYLSMCQIFINLRFVYFT